MDNSLIEWVELFCYPIKDPRNGQVTGIVEFVRNVTELKKMEEELQRERSLFRTIIDILPVAVYAKDLETRKILTNKTDLEYMGLERSEDALGKTDFEIYSPEIASAFNRDDRYVMNSGNPIINREDKAYAKDGEVRWLLTSKIPLRDDQGKIVGLVGVGRDITEREHAKDALRESERQFRELFENSRDGFVFVDTEARFRQVNRAYSLMLGYTSDELKEKGDFYAITPPHWHEWEKTEIIEKRLLKEGYSGIYQKEYIRKNGTVFPVELQAYTVFDENGEPLYFWAIVRDISERKHTEERIRHLSFHDHLTGLYHRAFIEEELHRLDDSRELPLGVVMCDVNGLKLVNDAFGHQEGDKLLQRFASVLQRSCRIEDLIGRWGGDEFIILLPRSSQTIYR